MATLSSAGVGSGLDVASLVTQLVAAERAPAQNRINGQQSAAQTRLSAYGTFRAGMGQLADALGKLEAGNTFGAHSAKSSAETVFTARASSAAAPGSYAVEVLEKAQAHKLVSASYASSSAVVGNGTVTVSMGAESFSVTLADGANTLADLRDALNQASDNPGVTATLVNESGGTRLLLTARETGTANALTLTSASAPLLPLLPPGPAFISSSTQQAASDARIRVDGFEFTGSGNTFDTAIDGLTIHVVSADPGSTHTLTVSGDPAPAKAAAEALVRGFNIFAASVATLTRYDAASRSGGALLGDALVRSANQQVRSALTQPVDGNPYGSLSGIGLSLQADGTLKLDSARFEAALAGNPGAVEALLGEGSGLAGRMRSVTDSYLDSDGRVADATATLQSRLDGLEDQQTRLDRRMEDVQRRYLAQFTALDTLISQMQSTSSFLSQQLAQLDF